MKQPKDYENMSVYEQVLDALHEGLAHARGEITLKTTVLPTPAPQPSRSRVTAIRKRLGMSQSIFAAHLNVPTKTLQSWEQGARVPKAGEARLLQIAELAPEDFVRLTLGRRATEARSSKASRKPKSRRVNRAA